jgi:predicted transposase YdaD
MYFMSLKVYRDLKNVIDTAFDDGKAEGKAEGLAEGRNEEKLERITLMLKKGKLSVEEIADIFEVTTQFVAEIKAELNL